MNRGYVQDLPLILIIISHMRTTPYFVLVALSVLPVSFMRADEPDFNRDVRPILSDKCYFCHGPDAEDRQAELRLDTFKGAQDVIESGYLLERILAEDPAERMPPPEAKLSLSKEDKEILKSWVEHGGKYEVHWAFQPPAPEVSVPNSKRDEWSKQTLDRFVWDSLDKRGLQPNAEAEPLRWLRRVTFDLTGLPPTLAEMDDFRNSLDQEKNRDAVYGDVVDRLLAAPSYGEHMAIAWLDAARYADSYGYQSDRLNTQWPYRDWVVKAFNENLPYDEFLTWQLAGDLLESPTREQRLATAFNRIHRLNNEGGSVFEEWRIENVADRVQTFGTAVLGLTLECCRCHDHKYDPIPMRDFYSMAAFFNSIDENGVYDNSEKVPAPSLLLPTVEQQQKLDLARTALEKSEGDYSKAVKDAADRFRQWAPSGEAQLEIPGLIRSLSFDVAYQAKLKDEVYYPGAADAYLTKPLDMLEVTASSLPRLDPRESNDGAKLLENEGQHVPRKAVQLDGERGVVMPGIELFDRWTPFSVTISMRETQRAAERSVIAQCSFGQLTFNGWDLSIADGYPEFRMYRVWPGNAIGVRATQKIPANQWLQISATYDGSSRAKGLKIHVNGEELQTEVVRDRIKKKANAKVHHGGKLTIGQRFRDRGLAGGMIDDVRIFRRALTPAEVKSLATGEAIEPELEYFVSAIDKPAMEAFGRLTQARKDFVLAEEAAHEIPVMEEMSGPRETHVLARGAYDAPTSDETRVSRQTLASIGPKFPSSAPVNRLGLARWATLPDHPLTSRVIVNRLWSNFFGHGLVRTPENFGLQGALPTHPELLDWLARDFNQ